MGKWQISDNADPARIIGARVDSIEDGSLSMVDADGGFYVWWSASPEEATIASMRNVINSHRLNCRTGAPDPDAVIAALAAPAAGTEENKNG